MSNKDLEQQLYDALIQQFLNKLDSDVITDKELKVIKDFIIERDIGVNSETHEPTKNLTAKLPFDEQDEEFEDIAPIKRIK
jgi:hypothetical protein